MRTTVVIDDQLFVSAKKLAAERGTSVSAIVVEALRGFVNRKEERQERASFVMPTFEGRGEKVDSTPRELQALGEEGDLSPFRT